MQIHQIYTHNELRNFTYVLELTDQSALVIDPWDANETNQFLKSNNLSLRAIINTHEHWDHTKGNQDLVDSHQCEVWAHENGTGKIPAMSRSLKADELISLPGNDELLVLDTPGHTFAHCCFIVKQNGEEVAVFTGDTLFNAGVGRCSGGGNEEVLYKTISEKIQSLDDSMTVYPGHDYLENNLRFTLKFEPCNSKANSLLEQVLDKSYLPGSIQTNIALEKEINTFLRLTNRKIKENLEVASADPKTVFLALRTMRDNW